MCWLSEATAMSFEAAMLSLTVWKKLGIAMAVFIPARYGRGRL